MPLLTVIIVLIVASLLMWLVNSYIPMSAGINKLLNVVVIIIIVVWLIKVSGLLKYLQQVSL